MLVNHPKIKNPIKFEWIGNLTHIYSEIYDTLLSKNLSLFGKLVSILDFTKFSVTAV